MMTVVRALSAREPLWVTVTAVLPIVAAEGDADPTTLRDRYGDVFASLGMSAHSERDLALITGAVETSKWVLMAAELAGVDPEKFWQNYLARMLV